jgi:hypothetical protein
LADGDTHQRILAPTYDAALVVISEEWKTTTHPGLNADSRTKKDGNNKKAHK